MCLDFNDPLQKHCLFQQSIAKTVNILEITCKEIGCNGYQTCEKQNKFYQLSVKLA